MLQTCSMMLIIIIVNKSESLLNMIDTHYIRLNRRIRLLPGILFLLINAHMFCIKKLVTTKLEVFLKVFLILSKKIYLNLCKLQKKKQCSLRKGRSPCRTDFVKKQ